MKSESDNIREKLSNVGISINDIYDLVNTNKSYSVAIPVLIKILEEGITDDNLKEGIVRALTVKEAKGMANKILLDEYFKNPKSKQSLRWAIGNAFATIITENDVEEILRIVMNKDNGSSRQMFVFALGKIKSERSEKGLNELLNDDEVTPHALIALGRLKSKLAKEKIERLINHPKPLIRREAEKALKKYK